MILQLTTDFVLRQDVEFLKPSPNYAYKKDLENLNIIHSYAKFVKQTINVGMFVPCDEHGNVLEKPNESKYSIEESNDYKKDLFKYLEAKEKVLFEGFEFRNNGFYVSKENVIQQYEKGKFKIFTDNNALELQTIEDLASYNIELTESAIKQISLL